MNHKTQNKMKVLITGVNGFVGTYLKNFLKKKHYDIHGIDRNISQNRVFKADITDKDKVLGIVEEVEPELIFHLAAQSSVAESFKAPGVTEKVNVTGTKNILDSLHEVAKKIAPGYPGMMENEPGKTLGQHEQLYAIDCAYQGIKQANDDLHKLIELLRNRLGWSTERVIEFWEENKSIELENSKTQKDQTED